MDTILNFLRPYQQELFKSPKRFKIANWSRQTGKSTVMAGLLCYTSLVHEKDGLSICVSTNLRSASEIMKKVVKFAEAVEVMSQGRISYTSSFDRVTFSTGARVISVPAGDGTAGRGFTIKGALLIDEAAYIPHLEELLQGIGPTLTVCKDAQLVLASTPSGRNHPFYKLWCQAVEDDEWYASKVTIDDAIAQGLNVDIDQLHKLVPDPLAFATEYMCEFAAESSQFIDISLLDFFDDVPSCKSKWLGVDVGSTHDKSAFCTLGTVNDDIYVIDIETLSKAEYTHQQSKILALNQKNNYTGGYIDACGLGGPLAEYVNKSPNCSKIKGFVTTGTNKPKQYERLRSKIFERKIHFAKSLKTALILEISKLSRIVNDKGIATYVAERDSEGHCDRISALVLALQAWVDNPASFSQPLTYQRMSPFGSWSSRL